MKGATIVSIFMAVMVFIGSMMQPANVNETSSNIETSIVEVETY